MTLFSILDQKRNLRALKNTCKNERIASSYLFYGNEGSGKETVALEYAAMLNCESDGLEACGTCPSCIKMSKLEHSNLRLVYPLKIRSSSSDTQDPFSSLKEEQIEEIQDEIRKKSENPYHKISLSDARSIPISFIRYIKKNIYLSSESGGWKVVIILDAHLMTNQAANAFLKVLEEPPDRSIFILTTSKKSDLLPTIKSRCQQLYFPPLKNETIAEALNEHDLPENELNLIVNLAGGSFSEASWLLEQDIAEIKSRTINLLRTLARWDKKTIYNYLDKLSRLYKDDSKAFRQLIRSIGFWFRDAAYIQAGNGREKVIHSDQFTEISNFVENYPGFQPTRVNKALQNCIDLLERNVYINLVLMETFFKIREFAFKRNKK